MAAICHCICILQLAFNDYRMESKILRRVRYVMNILPSFSPYPSSSLPLTKTGKKGTARDNEQKKSKIMVAEAKPSREIRLSRSDQVARRATRGALRSKVARGRAGAMRGANPLPAVSHRRNRRSASRQTFRIVWITRKAGEPCRSGDVEKKPCRTWRSCRSKEPQADESYTVDLLQKSPTLFR